MSEQAMIEVPVWTEADRLGKALRHAHMKHQEMADYLGVSRNTIGNYVSGRVAVDKRTRMLWAMKTHVAPEWLERGEAPGGPGNATESTHLSELERLAAKKRRRTRRAAATDQYLPAA